MLKHSQTASHDPYPYSASIVHSPIDFALSLLLGGQFVDEFLQRSQFSPLDQAKLLNEENKVLERCVEMRLLSQLYHFAEVLMINVGVHPKQTFQDRFGYRLEVFRKWNP